MEETDQPCLYYIKGKNYSVAVDAGNSQGHVEEFYEELRKNDFALPKVTVITHWHWDHTFGLAYVNGTTMATALTNTQLQKVSGWKWTPEEMEKREQTGEDVAYCNECIKKVYPILDEIKVKSVQTEITQKTILDLGDITVELIPHDSTHSRDSLFVYVPEEKAFFVGDADCEDLFTGEFDKDKLEDLYEFVKSFDFNHYLLGHDEPDTREGALNYFKEEIVKKNT